MPSPPAKKANKVVQKNLRHRGRVVIERRGVDGEPET